MDACLPGAQWWEPRRVAVAAGLRWELGPLILELFRTADSWWLWLQHREVAESAPSRCRLVELAQMPAEEGGERFVFRESPEQVRLRPLLADRSVVVRSRQPVFVPAGEEATLYLSTPVWLAVEVGEPPSLLLEVAGERLSDTWFGPSTREGELCYAGRTHARSQLATVPRRAQRAITPLTVINRAKNPLPLEKLNLPVPLLGLYGDSDGALWTEAVQLSREADQELAGFKVVVGAPAQAPEARRLSPPRREAGRSGLVRAFSDFLG